ncbi:MAG: ATP-grasp domain-containing protein [Lachnospiraceae bacterium]|nr:ATP-grasp domain-containing protein [Lachnospiraceae bacterium]
MKHKLLILGSMHEFVKLVKDAGNRGYETFVCDGYTDGPAKEYADHAYDLDIHKIDEIAALCKEQGIDGIITSFSDILFEYMVKIAEKAGLKTYCTNEKSMYLREKQKMKEMFSKLHIPMAKSCLLREYFASEELSGLRFPVVMKPVNGYGSRGVFVVNSEEEIRERFFLTSQFSTFQQSILVEEYNDGYEINMMNWILDGEVYTISMADREKSVEIAGDIPHVSRIAYPSRIMNHMYDEAREIVKKTADYTGIRTGPLCMQFFYRPEDGIQVCECAGRIFGYEHELVAYGSGLCLEDLLLDYVYEEEHLKERLAAHDPFKFQNAAGIYFHGREGSRIRDYETAETVIKRLGARETLFYYKPGEMVGHGIGAKPYVFRVFIEADSRDSLDGLTKAYYEQMEVPGEDGENLIYGSQMKEYDL